MTSSQPRYFRNDLQPVRLDNDSLKQVLAVLRKAVVAGVEEIERHVLPPPASDHQDSLYTDSSGVYRALPRWQRQR